MSLDIKDVLDKLPVMPKEVENLLDTLKQDFVQPKILESKLVACPVIAGRVLQIANSSFYGLSREISSLREATIILGQHALKSLIYSLAAMDQFKGSKNTDTNALDYSSIWKHSLYAACIARSIAEDKKLNAADIFTAALFQHFGILILESIEHQKITEAIILSSEKQKAFLNSINDLCGLNYIALSAKALNHWHFPVSVCDMIHSVESNQLTNDASEETSILLLSNFIASAYFKSSLSVDIPALTPVSLSIIENEDHLLQLLKKADLLYSQMASDFIG